MTGCPIFMDKKKSFKIIDYQKSYIKDFSKEKTRFIIIRQIDIKVGIVSKSRLLF